MTILILHGVTGHAGVYWQQWLHDELIKQGHTVIMPTLPNTMHPDRYEWLEYIKAQLKKVNLNDLIIIGHSLGVPAALDFIEQADAKVKALVSVSGFTDNYDSPYNDFYMKVKSIDLSKVKQNIETAYVIYGDDDPYVPQANLQKLATDLGVNPTIVAKGGHLNSETGYDTFPLLLETITKLISEI